MPAITGWHDHSTIQREVFVNVPTAMKVAFYGAVATMLLIVAWLASLRVRNWERGLADNRRTTRNNVERRAKSYRNGVWMQTLLRDPAAGIMHSLLYFGFVVAVHRDRAERDRPPAARPLQVPARPDLRGLLRRRPRSRASCSSPASCGRSPAATAAPLPDPHQDQARGRASSSARSSSSGSPASSSKRVRIAAEGKPYFEKWSFVGYGARRAHRHVVGPHPADPAPLVVGSCTWSRSSRSSRSCRPRSCATCSRHR